MKQLKRVYLTPCILAFSQRYMASNKTEAVPLKTINTQKKINKLLISTPKNEGVFAPGAAGESPAPGGIKADNVPANLFAAAFAKNHVPISKEDKRSGANLLTMLKPIGDKQSSPMVCTMYSANSQNIAILVEASTP